MVVDLRFFFFSPFAGCLFSAVLFACVYDLASVGVMMRKWRPLPGPHPPHTVRFVVPTQAFVDVSCGLIALS